MKKHQGKVDRESGRNRRTKFPGKSARSPGARGATARRVTGLLSVGAVLALLVWLMLPSRGDLRSRPSSGSDETSTVRAERDDVTPRFSVDREATLVDSAPTRLFGQVRSSAGQALQASVCWADGTGVRAPERCTPTDRQGRFAVEVPESGSSLIASAAGHLPEAMAIAHQSGRHELNFSLSRGGASVSGQVLDASGGPVIDALVSARSLASDTRVATVLSDSSGKFELSLPAGPISLRARAEGYADGVGGALSAPAEQVSLVLIAASRIVGRVVDEGTDTPIAGVVVTAVNKNGTEVGPFNVETDEAGTFRLSDVPPGGYELSAAGPRWKGAAVWVNVGLGQTTEEVVLTLQPATTLQASLHVAGEACRDGTVRLVGPSATFASVGAEGVVRVDGLLPGRYAAEVRCPPGIPRDESLEIGLGPATARWDLELGLSVRGRVESASGQPRASVSVAVEPVEPARSGTTCSTNEAGEFDCSGLLPGEYDCRANGVDAVSDPVRVALDESKEGIVLTTQAAGRIEVSVDGVPEPSAVPWMVFAKNEEQRLAPAVAKPEGARFVFENLPLGAYEVYAGGDVGSGSAAAKSVVLQRSGEVLSVNLKAPASESIAGRVTDAQGTPVIDALVRAFVADPVLGGALAAGAAATTNDEGGFVLDGLSRGRYDLRVSDSSGEASVRGVQTGTSELTVRLEAYAGLTGTVRDSADELVPTFDLTYQRGQGELTSIAGHVGSWSLPWLPPGAYVISVQSAAGSASQRVELAPGEQRTVNLLVESSSDAPDLPRATLLETSPAARLPGADKQEE